MRGRALVGAVLALGLALAVVLAALASRALRDDPIERAASAARAAAREMRDRAFEHLHGERYAEAITALEHGYAALPHPAFLLDVALAYHAWGGHCAEAVSAARRFEAACPSCPARVESRASLAALYDACTGALSLDSVPTGAAIRVAGAPSGSTPALLHLLPGTHEIELSMDDREPARLSLTIERGARVERVLELAPR